MRKKVFRKRAAAFTIAAAMVLSVVNVPAIGNWQMPMAEVQAAEAALYTNDAEKSYEIDFSELETEDWGKQVECEYDMSQPDTEMPEKFNVTADIAIDEELYGTLTDDNYFKVQSVLKLGDDWTWTSSSDIKTMTADSFIQEGSSYKTSITIAHTDVTADTLKGVEFVIVGMGAKGTVTISNVIIEAAVVMEKTTLYQNEEEKTAADVDFSSLEELDWTEKGAVTFTYDAAVSGVTVTEDFEVTADIEIDAEAFATLAEGKYFLVQSVVKLGDNWTWTDSQDIKTLNADSFEGEDGNYKTSITISHTGVTVDALREVLFKIVGVGFKGDIKFSNVVISGLAPETAPELTPQDPKVVADFEEGIEGWEGEPGWDYSHGKTDSEEKTESAEAEWDEESQSLKMIVDYSADAASGWSEAKVKGTFEPVDVSNYNLVSFTLRYPSDMDTVRTKLFMSDAEGTTTVLDAEGSFRSKTVENLGNGWSTVTIRGEFKPKNIEVTNLTIGIVGPYADLKTVYIDDVTIGQLDASEDYVKITEKVKETGDKASLEGMAEDVKLVDSNATDETKVLAAYLAALQAGDQVLFGHQNSTFKSVRYNGEISDIKDITGSEAGLFGIDTLALAGCETAQTTRQGALDASVAASMAAYNGGSIITLSCHMPNFTNSKITETGDEKYPYDFTKCDFMESKDMTPCADYILDGGKYNPQFNAYLDIIADYALALQAQGIPVLFRPFHENSGNWFWWGTSTSVESYQAIWRYMVAYLEEKGVHNFLYVYSPNGPFSSETQYLERYPGDAYVDVIAFDFYDDYADVDTYTGAAFFEALAESCQVVASIAEKKNKIPAIAETGIRITGAGKDSLMVTGNPTTGHDWYNQVVDTAAENNIPYFLLWANFDSSNFFVPYKYNDELGQEMINDFIKAYNNDKSIFGNGTNFYTTGEEGATDAALSKTVNGTGYSDEITGYMISPKNYAVIKEPCDMQASVKNAAKVEFQVKASDAANAIIVEGVKAADSNIYTGTLSAEVLAEIGPASTGSVIVVAYDAEGNSVIIGSAKFINFNKDADVLPQNVIDNFEFYYGSDGLLQSKWGDDNSAAGCSSTMTLDSENKVEGEYSGAFEYTLTYKGSEVWTGGLGRVFDADKTDFTAYNAISMWVKPDGNGQKMVIQLNDSYEAYLSDFVKGTKAQYVTIPFTSFIKKGGTEAIDSANIYSFRLWCNSIPENYPGVKAENGNYTVSGIINFDDIKAVKISDEDLDKADDNGLIITDAALKDLSGESGDDKKEDDKKEDDKKPVDPQPETQGPGTTGPGTQTPQPAAKGTVIVDEATGAEFTITVSDAVNGEAEYKKSTNAKATKVTIPDTITKDGITYKVTSIAKNAFKGNKKLKTVKIGRNIKTIGVKAFYKCTKLTKITIPATVTKIGKLAFANCKNLKKITIKTTKLTNKNVGAKAFKGIYSKATIKVPKAKLKAYKTLLKKKGVGSKAKIKK